MKHLDQHVYAGTALVAALATVAALYATQPVDLGVSEAANAAPPASAVTWRGVPDVILHEARGTDGARR